ncbi:MAG: NAD-dependent epimerase/dehydratase family protein [Opitutae bacterium]|jgi:UDP-N-acetylglucosamine 4-epimerase|nr:NAD-dependent epimerase/dehydratase family protein [Opitutae bacterium]
MKHVLVTGGAGFIGKNVAKYAIKIGIQVTIIDWATLSSEESIEFIKLGINYIQYDIRDTEKLNTIDGKYDSIIHLAAQVSVPKSFTHQKETEEINIEGTANVISLAKRLGIKRFILASSSAVYGDCKDIPLTEDNTGTLLSPYAKTKHENEEMIKTEFEEGNEFLALRFFNVYGSGQSANSQYAAVIPKFLQCVKKSEPITIFGDGKQSRDFVHVSDVSRLLVTLSVESWSSPGQHVFNVGTGQSCSISQLVELIQDINEENPSLEIRYEDERSGDILHSVASILSIKEQLNWEPMISFEQGLRQLIKGF